ncbi:MAG TPA: alpha,alpha-trehalase TreA [Flavisolibacter sp.]|nr:alpha,alpha-trehalase TreA [Flavisolibacter sp.]
MKPLFFFFLLLANLVQAQTTPTPDKLWGKLFEDVQLKRALGDNKTFVDMVPQHAPAVILKKYNEQKITDSAALRTFVLSNFYLPATPEVNVKEGLTLREHLNDLWDVLTRKADTKQQHSSLLPLPKPYIVPGGRFREIYYWDSYFTMLGLVESNRLDLVENMLDNFKLLIDQYGHIPNGNRNYYLSRSQPPFFALMVDLLKEKKGTTVYRKYYSAMEKEYMWWMQGASNLKKGQAHRRVVKMPDGMILNRYFDDKKAPREESYSEDVHTAKNYKHPDGMVYTNLRAGAESGWDFSSRWFADTLHLNTIETTNIIPVDLNSLLYAYENILSKAATATTNKSKSVLYKQKALKRRAAVLKYCWNEKLQYFFDYDRLEKHTTDKWSAAGMMPLFVNIAVKHQSEQVKRHVETKFLKDGGIVTTLYHTGQQWDAPNGWPPLQWIAVKGLMNYGYNDLAKQIADRWMNINEKVFAATGKMMEKYNVENINLESGGGEYPTQDGFGWSNGVYLKFYQLFRNEK